MVPTLALSAPGLTAPARARFRPPRAAIPAYLGLLLVLELLGELWLPGEAGAKRALVGWCLLVLAIAPVLALVAWRGYQADLELATVGERDLVRRLALALTAEHDPARVPTLLAKQARELGGARLAFLAQPDDDGFRVAALVGDGPPNLLGQRLPIGPDSPGLGGQALRTGRAVALPDTWCEAGLAARRELALSDKVRSAAVVPLLIRGQVVGLIGLHAEAAGQLDEQRAALLGLYAEHAAGPFHTALLAASVNQLNGAKQLDQLKVEFLSAVAHELRTPLNPILGWSELLLQHDYASDQARPMLQQIHEGAQHLAVLVGDLLDLSGGQAGRLTLELQDLDLGELLEAAVARWREQAPQHSFVLAAAGRLPLRGDRHRLRQVLDNLLSNATKYSPPGTRVFVTARADPGGRVVVRVSDQGLGLSPDEREQLFSKFYRGEAARQHAPGTGLGLALCGMILEAHGGRIQAESEGRGTGSAFTVSLPAAGPVRAGRAVQADFATLRG